MFIQNSTWANLAFVRQVHYLGGWGQQNTKHKRMLSRESGPFTNLIPDQLYRLSSRLTPLLSYTD